MSSEMLLLPHLENDIYKISGNKNYISQLLAPSFKVKKELLEQDRSYIVIGDSNNQVCLTCNKERYSSDVPFVILTDKRSTLEKINEGEIRFKEWIKHPQKKEITLNQVTSSWKNTFLYKEEDIEAGVNGLRLPQISAIYSILSHLKVSDETGVVVMPTGTGKTETMLSTLIANRCGKLLVTVPSDALRGQIYEKFFSLGLLKQFGIIGQKALYPKVGILKQKFENVAQLEDFFNRCNVIITTMSIASGSLEDQQEKMAELCSHLFIDEAHHVKASSWDLFKNKFLKEKVLLFTATPFRNDQKRLDGKIIFNFPLKKAQEQGYFKKINFIPIRQYDQKLADKEIAEIAVAKLREGHENGFKQILLARCKDTPRAQEIFELYKEYDDLNPVVIHSNVKNKNQILKQIINKEHKIIVAVDMLGEGFDLPELKIAAFHDIRKSLPITLQFAGRFTRTRYDEELGEASFIANLADINVGEELEELYSQDSDWNNLLPSLSANQIDEEIDFSEFISGFTKLDNLAISLQNIRTPLSAVVYKNHTDTWNPKNFVKGLSSYSDSDYKFSDINSNEKILIIVTANKKSIEWGNFKDIYELQWDITIVYWESKNNLLFIYDSNKEFHKDLAESIIGEKAELINQINIFKAFYGLKRITLQNVGLKEFLGKNISFRMAVGTDVEKALSLAEKQKGQKAFVSGTGYKEGTKFSLGCSYKGRVWSKLRGGLKEYVSWANDISKKLADDTIDPNLVLKEALMPSLLSERPCVYPICLTWHEEMYLYPETKYTIQIGENYYDLSSCELNVVSPSEDEGLFFEISTEDDCVKFEIEFIKKEGNNDEEFDDFQIINKSDIKTIISYGRKEISIDKFFYENPPTIWFADGSALTGNYYIKLKQSIVQYPVDNLITWDWDGVDIKKEAQGVEPKLSDSIQYHCIQKLEQEDVDIIYDDDGSGEIADVVTIKQHSNKLLIDLYHLKFAKNGVVSTRIDNFYEVCGQAQKSIHWKHRTGKEFLNHLLRREIKKKNGKECSRIEKGTRKDLESLLKLAKRQIPLEIRAFIVQPGLSKSNPSDSVLTLLGVTENYLMELGGIELKVIVNS